MINKFEYSSLLNKTVLWTACVLEANFYLFNFFYFPDVFKCHRRFSLLKDNRKCTYPL